MNIYIAGKITGATQEERDRFHTAAAKLRAGGHRVYNPMEQELPPKVSQENTPSGVLSERLRKIVLPQVVWIAATADAIAVLPDSENSKGTKSEIALGQMLGLEIAEVPRSWFQKKDDCLFGVCRRVDCIFGVCHRA